jgi:hypothetical protein
MHFINLLRENAREVVILTHHIKTLLIDITWLRLPILRVVVVGLAATPPNSPIEFLKGLYSRLQFHDLLYNFFR